jgi:hypothetical protein
MLKTQVIDVKSPTWNEVLESLRHDIYHLPGYLDLEAKRTGSAARAVLIEEGDRALFLPYVIRRCDSLFGETVASDALDASSPYGYPGPLLNQPAAGAPEFVRRALEALKEVWRSQSVCSAFVRLHPVLNDRFQERCPDLACRRLGGTVSIDLTLSPDELWRQTRRGHRWDINRSKRLGMTARFLPVAERMRDFVDIYEETMRHVGASSSYFFGHDYFTDLSALTANVHLCGVEVDGELIAAGLFTECCGTVQYHLSGTRTRFLGTAPGKLMIDHVRSWAKARANTILHLGGGVGSARDGLYEFKAGFATNTHDFVTLRVIVNDEQYRHLVDLRARSLGCDPGELLDSDYFPAYRSTAPH